jgi:hypothetical protein
MTSAVEIESDKDTFVTKVVIPASDVDAESVADPANKVVRTSLEDVELESDATPLVTLLIASKEDAELDSDTVEEKTTKNVLFVFVDDDSVVFEDVTKTFESEDVEFTESFTNVPAT